MTMNMATINAIEYVKPAIVWALILAGICLGLAFLIKFAYSPICNKNKLKDKQKDKWMKTKTEKLEDEIKTLIKRGWEFKSLQGELKGRKQAFEEAIEIVDKLNIITYKKIITHEEKELVDKSELKKELKKAGGLK